MKYIKLAILIVLNNIKSIIKKIMGCNIQLKNPILISLKANIGVNGKNSILQIGKKTAIRANSEVMARNGKIIIGNNCFVNKNCMIIAHEYIEIGDGTTIGPNVCIYDHDHDVINGGYISAPINIGSQVWIGAGVIILKGIVIGDNCVIAAGAIVTKNVPANTLFIQKMASEKYKIKSIQGDNN
ncbi:MAG: DapH/DapD/GlmU-related protein [Eubacteriales bacterium]